MTTASINMNECKTIIGTNECKTIIGQVPISQLIDPTFFVIDFIARKFLFIGLNPVDNFNVIIQIITPSSYLCITPETLQLIFTKIGDILSIDTPQLKTKTSECLVNNTVLLNKIIRRGEIKLVLQSISNGGKVLLTKEDLIVLQHTEWCALDSVSLKTKVIRPMVLRQLEQMIGYLKSNFSHTDTLEDKILVIRNVLHEALKSLITNEDMCFVSQLKLYANRQIAEKWISETRNQTIKVERLLTSLSSSSSPSNTEEIAQCIDENDGPLYFNRYPPPPLSPTYAIHPHTRANINKGYWWER